MSNSNFWTFAALLAAGYGLAFVFAPAVVGFIYGVDYAPPVKTAFQYFGTALIGFGVFCWVAKDVAEPAVQRKLLLAHGVSDVFGVAVSLIATFEHTVNALGWFNVGLYAALAAWCTYLYQQTSLRYAPVRP